MKRRMLCNSTKSSQILRNRKYNKGEGGGKKNGYRVQTWKLKKSAGDLLHSNVNILNTMELFIHQMINMINVSVFFNTIKRR